MAIPLKGRPKREVVEELKKQGEMSKSPYKCSDCNRVFQRSKNLRKHVLIHGKRAYVCDFPGCVKDFTQSNHLVSHLRRHSTENPFRCPFEGCNTRHKHSNRHCLNHPDLKLIRQPQHADEIRTEFFKDVKNVSEDNRNWLEKFLCKREKMQFSPEKERKSAAVKRKKNAQVEEKENATVKRNKNDETEASLQNVIMKQINCEEDASLKTICSEEDDDVIMEFSNIDDALLLYVFVKGLQEKGGNSKALFEEVVNGYNLKTQN